MRPSCLAHFPLCLLASGLWLASPLAQAAACSVAVDVGHYLAAPGAISAYGRSEFSYNLALAKQIRRALLKNGCHVQMVGADGHMRSLRARTAAARKPRLFLSVHHDSADLRWLQTWHWQGQPQHYSERFAGFSLFVSHENPHYAASLRCASQIGAALRGLGMRPSRYHADAELGPARPFADEANGVHDYDGLAVLRSAVQPAVLFEAGVIIHPEEARRLAMPAQQAGIAAAVADAVRRCLD